MRKEGDTKIQQQDGDRSARRNIKAKWHSSNPFFCFVNH